MPGDVNSYRWGDGKCDLVIVDEKKEPSPVPAPERPPACEIVGKKVRSRGPTWKWGEQGDGELGTVKEVENTNWVRVVWDSGIISCDTK